METNELSDLVGTRGETGAETDSSTSILPLVADSGNQRVLLEWLTDHESYEAVEGTSSPFEADFDLCIIDGGTLQEYREELKTAKADSEPVLLPVLLLLPETRSDVIETDEGDIADNVFPTTIDEIVSLPIRQTELEWRIQSLLRLRNQSITTQRQNAELRLFQQAVESTGHAIYITDTDGIIKYVNDAFEEMTGYTRAEAVGADVSLVHPGIESEEYFQELHETIRNGEVWEGDIVDERKDGESYTAAQTVAPVSEGGDVSAVVAVQKDITERREREETLKRRTHAIEETPVGITITDPSRDHNPMIYVNDAFSEMTGYSRSYAVGRNCRFLQGEDTDPERVGRIRAAIDAEEPISIELRNYRKNGTEFWNHLEIAPVRDATGTVINWVGFQQEVTERKERLRQLGVLDRTLRHTLRNDMNVIRGHAESIQSHASTAVAESAEQIIEASNDLLAMAEKEKAITSLLRDRPRQLEFDIPVLLRYVADEVRADHPRCTIDVACPEDVAVVASEEFDEGVREVVTNAATHTDASSSEVEITVEETGETVCISIADTGPQIPEIERQILLDSEPEVQTELRHGSGLGLWLVRLIVTRSNGSIDVAENSPRGNVIRLELPRAET
ncbi:PAS domain S-box protein [Halorientalis litorea]|uniref:PAS domain S-box protein n=1 Tax=Halorientalis litorea TaxID=2931977 RepID=UPI001FF61103|nr:PAS domain S-box protein [Halorientalis litorea]